MGMLQITTRVGAINVAINNKRRATFGLVSMLDYYNKAFQEK